MKRKQVIAFLSLDDVCEMHDMVINEQIYDDLYELAINTAASKINKEELADFFKLFICDHMDAS